MVAHTFNPNTQKAEAAEFCEFEARLVNKASSRTARAVNTVWKTKIVCVCVCVTYTYLDIIDPMLDYRLLFSELESNKNATLLQISFLFIRVEV